MTKDEILAEFDKISFLNERDTGTQMQSSLEFAKIVYKDNKIELIEVLHDWLLNDNPNTQLFALLIIKNLKIYELKKDVYSLKSEVIKTRKQPFLRDDLKYVEKTISVLEKGQAG
jgi:hypothetical protein